MFVLQNIPPQCSSFTLLNQFTVFIIVHIEISFYHIFVKDIFCFYFELFL